MSSPSRTTRRPSRSGSSRCGSRRARRCPHETALSARARPALSRVPEQAAHEVHVPAPAHGGPRHRSAQLVLRHRRGPAAGRRQAGLAVPTLEALTRVWRGEATSEVELAAKLTTQRPADVATELARLRRDGFVAPDGALRTTDKGAQARQAIEDETDRLFYSGWPDDVASSSGWIQEKLAVVNASF